MSDPPSSYVGSDISAVGAAALCDLTLSVQDTHPSLTLTEAASYAKTPLSLSSKRLSYCQKRHP